MVLLELIEGQHQQYFNCNQKTAISLLQTEVYLLVHMPDHHTFIGTVNAIILFLQDNTKQANSGMMENKLWESLFLAVMCLMEKDAMPTSSAIEKDTLQCRLSQVKVPC